MGCRIFLFKVINSYFHSKLSESLMRRYTNLFIVAFVLISMLVTAVVPALSVSASPLLAPSITPTMTDTIINDCVGGDPVDGQADPGGTIEYTATIPNLGTDATVVTLTILST